MRLSRWVATTLLVMLVALFFEIGYPNAAVATSWDITQLTTDAHRHLAARVSGDRVLWTGSDGTRYQIFTQKMGTDSAASQLTSSTDECTYGEVSGDRAVWQCSVSGTYRIFSQNIGVDASPIQLTSGTGYQIWPQVSGNRVVWSGTRESDEQVFTQKVGTDSSPTTLTNDPLSHYDYFRVSGDRVVWAARDDLGWWQVLTAKIGVDSEPVPLTAGLGNSTQPRVSGDRLVWSDGRILTAKMGVDSGPVVLTTPVDPADLEVSGDRVVWCALSGSTNQIFTQKIGVDVSPVQLTFGANDCGHPQVFGDRVVWEGSDGASQQIFTRKMGVDSVAQQLTFGANDSTSPYVSGDRIVWLGSDGVNNQVYSASLVDTTAPAIPCSTTLALVRSTATSAYDARVTLTATLARAGQGTPISGGLVIFERQSGSSWIEVGRANTNVSGIAAVSAPLWQYGRTLYRARFSAVVPYYASFSPNVMVTPQVYLTKPNAPLTMYKGKAKTVSGFIKPRHVAGTYPVRIYKYRYVSGKWKYYGYVNAKAANYLGYTRYYKSMSLGYAGKWRLRACAMADLNHAATWSSFDYVTVK